MLETGLSGGSKKDELYEQLLTSLDDGYRAEALSAYFNDPVKFVREVVGEEPTPHQQQMLNGLVKHKHEACRSGHGVGKTRGVAYTITWFLVTRPMAKVPVTAPTSHQLEDILWSELASVLRKMDLKFANQFDLTSEKLFHKEYREEWFCVARTARKEKPEALQGFHGQNLFFILEEAAGIPDELFEVSQGSLTSKDNMVLAVGNPTRLSGFFYDCFHRDRAQWHTLHFSSLDSPLVDQSYPERMATKYGEESNIYRVRVLGEFPTSEEDQLIPLDVLEAAVTRQVLQAGPIIW